jgi:hypothetical protein
MASPTKRCSHCGETKPIDDFFPRRSRKDGRVEYCRPCAQLRKRMNGLHERYGITPQEFDALMTSQGGGCAICRKPPRSRRLHVDHEHVTGRIRGLLCFKCNASIGYMHDSPALLQAAISYLETADTGKRVPVTEEARRARKEIAN